MTKIISRFTIPISFELNNFPSYMGPSWIQNNGFWSSGGPGPPVPVFPILALFPFLGWILTYTWLKSFFWSLKQVPAVRAEIWLLVVEGTT